MITPEQQQWLDHLSDTDTVQVVPYDTNAPRKFSQIKQRLRESLGDEFEIVHRGASALGISGQGELDVYIPTLPEAFVPTIELVAKKLGRPRSVYPFQRARFVTAVERTKVEVFVINVQSQDWIDGLYFETFLKNHPTYLEDYRLLKEEAAGQSTREYYRRKLEFINDIVRQRGA